MFFLERGDTTSSEAVAVCQACPVRVDCLEHALEKRELAGIWGGFTEKERRPIRKRWLAGVRGVDLLP